VSHHIRNRSVDAVPNPIHVIPVAGLPEICPGDDLAALIANSARQQDCQVAKGDILVVAQKVVSKAEGRIVPLADIVPSREALEWADRWSKDPRLIEVVLQQSKAIIRMERGIIVSETAHGFICANAGVDASNTAGDTAILLPEDPDRSARQLQARLGQLFSAAVGVIISDTFGRAWREGLVNVALGVAGVPALTDYRGQLDGSGKLLHATLIATADEIASAAELVMGKADRIPIVIVRGFSAAVPPGSGADLIRPAERDLFR
jgi:coenzyme F420-0:L-glutamate ligase/coenzyme F420-1:gamma-L-glutamate ligase